MPDRDEIASAAASGKLLRVHRRDGEVIVLRVLDLDEHELVYDVHTSSHPERYAVCDSTGFRLPFDEIERVQALERPPPRFRSVLE